MASILFKYELLEDASVLGTKSTELNPSDLAGCIELTYYIVFGPGTSAGAVQIESAHEAGYQGTWSPEGTPTSWISANRVHKVSITGSSFVSRARITTGIVGGTVTVIAVGNG